MSDLILYTSYDLMWPHAKALPTEGCGNYLYFYRADEFGTMFHGMPIEYGTRTPHFAAPLYAYDATRGRQSPSFYQARANWYVGAGLLRDWRHLIMGSGFSS